MIGSPTIVKCCDRLFEIQRRFRLETEPKKKIVKRFDFLESERTHENFSNRLIFSLSHFHILGTGCFEILRVLSNARYEKLPLL